MPDPKDNVEELKAATAADVHRAVREEGEDERRRPTSALFWSGLAAGITIHASLLAEASLLLHGGPDTGELVVGLGYPIGFLLVILGRMQFFTESTITAMLPLVHRPSRVSLYRTLRLWGVVLAANLFGTLLAAAMTASGLIGHDGLSEAAITISAAFAEHAPLDIFINAIPAGFLIAVLAWSLPNAREQAWLVIFSVTYLIGIAGFSHSIVGSSEAFLLAITGQVSWPTAIFGLIVPAVTGNLIGGAGIFALLVHAQVRDEVEES